LVGTSESAIVRGYLNGVTPVWSAGERDGRSYAASVIAGWRFAIAHNARATPFIRLDAAHIELDAYTESGGPFPAAFDKLEDTIEASRIGVDGRLDLGPDLRADASLAWGHRMDGRLPTITGEVIGLVAFAVPGAELDRDWTEAHGSLTWSAGPGVNLRLGVGASTDGDTAPTLSAVIGVDMRF
jgi:outer membrane autotransporter protein